MEGLEGIVRGSIKASKYQEDEGVLITPPSLKNRSRACWYKCCFSIETTLHRPHTRICSILGYHEVVPVPAFPRHCLAFRAVPRQYSSEVL